MDRSTAVPAALTTRVPFVSLARDTRPQPRTAFEAALRRFLDDLFAAQPVWATRMGFHAYDDRWPDVGDSGRAALLAMLRHHRARLHALAEEELSADERVDRRILLEAIDGLEFGAAVLREEAWDPLEYVRLAGSGLLALLARDFAPWAHRGRALAARLERLPDLLRAAAQALVGLPERPVSQLHTETALGQIDGLTELIEDALAEAERRAVADDDPALLPALREAAEIGRQAVDEFRAALDTEIRQRAAGDGRLGDELFAAKLRHTLHTNVAPEELLARARHDYAAVRAEMIRLARELWPAWLPGVPLPAGDGSAHEVDEQIVRRALDAIAGEHRQPEDLLDWCRQEVARIETFCRDRSVIGLPDEPLRVAWTPLFMRAYGLAFLDSPGPLDEGLSSDFWITPPDESAGPEAVESYLREDNDRMLSLLCIHEAIPGHYLQLAWANRCPRLARAIFASSTFIEGWAVYVTQVMMDLGYRADDRALMLIHWKFYLRVIVNVLLDVEIHTGGLTEERALELMIRGAFQEEHEARAKWLRARLTSTQLSTYYVGSVQLWDLELEARRRAANTAGGDAGELPRSPVVGAIGPTPGFDYRSHLESVISHGSPPTRWLHAILFGETRPEA